MKVWQKLVENRHCGQKNQQNLQQNNCDKNLIIPKNYYK